MAQLFAGLACAGSPGHSSTLRFTSLILLLLLTTLAMAAVATAMARTAKTIVRGLQPPLPAAVFAGIVMGLTFVVITSSLLHRLFFRHRL